MAQHDDHDDPLPLTWPFRFAGLLVLAAMAWFCTGFGLHDVGGELAAYYPVFWTLIAVAIVMIIGGAAFNLTKRRID
jgi:hypothetical protein